MTATASPIDVLEKQFRPTSLSMELDTSPDAFGTLRDSRDAADNFDELRRRLVDDGYLYIPGLLERDDVRAARTSILEACARKGIVDDVNYPLEEGKLSENPNSGFSADIIQQNAAVKHVVFGDQIRAFYANLLDGPIRHFDFIWLRTKGLGQSAPPHCDIVYMGRGTFDVFTAWIPYGEVDERMGGLMILEGSHKQKDRLKRYLEHDVDSFCENKPQRRDGWSRGGSLTNNPVSLREKLGGRWLTAHFQPSDLLTFGMGMVHGSLDNQSDGRIRLSTDTRYQLASEAIDERWIGETPVGHSAAGKRGRIC